MNTLFESWRTYLKEDSFVGPEMDLKTAWEEMERVAATETDSGEWRDLSYNHPAREMVRKLYYEKYPKKKANRKVFVDATKKPPIKSEPPVEPEVTTLEPEADVSAEPAEFKNVSAPVPAAEPETKVSKEVDDASYGYIVGTIDGNILEEYNSNQKFYGASMNKPVLALVGLIMNKLMGKKFVSDRELTGLLAYRGVESNDINKKITRMISNEEVGNMLDRFGLGNMDVRRGRKNNQQSPQDYFKFLSLISGAKNVPELRSYSSEMDKILNFMKRSGLDFTDRESRKWLKLQKILNDQGIDAQTIYGKGGRFREALNYGFIINEKYILVIYTKWGDDRSKLYNKIADILKNYL